MANDWIKIRGAIFNSPKLIALSQSLQDDRDFREWMQPDRGGGYNAISIHAIQHVSVGLLCAIWARAREFGKHRKNGDCFLPLIDLEGLDAMCHAPGIGAAMAEVGWAEEAEDGIILPRFFLEHNAPAATPEPAKSQKQALSNAERQARFKQKQTAKSGNESNESNETVTASNEAGNGKVTASVTKSNENEGGIYRGGEKSKSREEKKEYINAGEPALEPTAATAPSASAINPLTQTAMDLVALYRPIRQSHEYESQQIVLGLLQEGQDPEPIRAGLLKIREQVAKWSPAYRDQFAPTSATFFRNRRWLDDPASWVEKPAISKPNPKRQTIPSDDSKFENRDGW